MFVGKGRGAVKEAVEEVVKGAVEAVQGGPFEEAVEEAVEGGR